MQVVLSLYCSNCVFSYPFQMRYNLETSQAGELKGRC